jgi:hypothetical protein
VTVGWLGCVAPKLLRSKNQDKEKAMKLTVIRFVTAVMFVFGFGVFAAVPASSAAGWITRHHNCGSTGFFESY